MLLDNHIAMKSSLRRLVLTRTHHLLLCGLALFTLSACSHAVQPWVIPESSQELKQLKIDNYLLKQELGLYRKKLMQANLESRRLAEKLQRLGQQPDASPTNTQPAVQSNQGMSSGMSRQTPPAVKTAQPRVQPARKAPAPVVSKPTPQAAPPAVAPVHKAAAPVAAKPAASKAEQPPVAAPVKAAPVKASATAPGTPADPAPVVAAVATPAVSVSNQAPVAQESKMPAAASEWKTVMTLYFDSGQRFTSPEMRTQLRKFANSLSPTARIRIAGHTDSRTILQSTGAVADNKAMSSERAWSVVRGLKAYGISAKRMQVGAFGATRPVTGNDTSEGRAKNRRVEILISE